MRIRSLMLATGLMVGTATAWAVDSDAPLAKEQGKARPLVVIARSTADPVLRGLNAALEDPATRTGFNERQLVMYSVAGMVGKRDDKNLEQQTTMALIRELQLGASAGTKVILIGKDGVRHPLATTDDAPIDMQAVFKAADALPADEQAIKAAAPVSEASSEAPASKAKAGKPTKSNKPSTPPQPLTD